MKIVHVGPPASRTGGPAGYLLALRQAGEGRTSERHQVLLPPPAPGRARVRQGGVVARVRSAWTPWRRRFLGQPQFFRPPEADLRTRGGAVHRSMLQAAAGVRAEAAESLARALSEGDVLFAHDPFCAEDLLARRTPRQRVWLMVHSPMPMGLYLTWNWGVPERDWRDVLGFPDVQAWIEWETALWARVDLLVLPCREAAEEPVRIDPRTAEPLARARFLLTAAAAPHTSAAPDDRAARRRRWRLPADGRVGLFLGNGQPYRGLDALLGSLGSISSLDGSAGILAVAGPPESSLSPHPRVRALGRVDDVTALLQSVDFVVNVNRFSLLDLSSIEALGTAAPLLLHAVGGNKALHELGAGSVMLPDLAPETLARGLERLFSMAEADLQELRRASARCYEAHFRADRLWTRHLDLYDEMAPSLLRSTAAG